MIAIMPMDEPRPRCTIIGRQMSGPLLSEAEHFKSCSLCGGFVNLRDRVWLEEHQQPLPNSGERSGAVARFRVCHCARWVFKRASKASSCKANVASANLRLFRSSARGSFIDLAPACLWYLRSMAFSAAATAADRMDS
jgi:hypothetical protein